MKSQIYSIASDKKKIKKIFFQKKKKKQSLSIRLNMDFYLEEKK